MHKSPYKEKVNQIERRNIKSSVNAELKKLNKWSKAAIFLENCPLAILKESFFLSYIVLYIRGPQPPDTRPQRNNK